MTTIVWIRHDFRFTDNPALLHACKESDRVVLVYIWSPEEDRDWEAGTASRWWLHHTLKHFQKKCREKKVSFVIRLGPVKQALDKLVKETKAEKIVWNRRYEPAGTLVDARVRAGLNIESETFPGNLLFEPNTIKTKQGKPFRVFTPFWKQCLALNDVAAPYGLPTFPKSPQRYDSLKVEDLELIHENPYNDIWVPGEETAQKNFKRFLTSGIRDYKKLRDLPAVEGVSRMSPYLHFGEISPRWMWDQIFRKYSGREIGINCYLSELGWREFAHHLLFHFPKTPQEPLYPKFKQLKWKRNKGHLEAWQQGLTGYPLVDAGMRQLWQTGWMHNRVRMIVGSFLVKDLLISWTEGARWFWETLVDADLANNTLGWQWVGGCGADAAPFFRVFNPVTQSEKFDPDGQYIKTWVPELQNVPKKWIHKPWEAPDDLEIDYPDPIVDHKEAREEALRAFDKIKGGK